MNSVGTANPIRIQGNPGRMPPDKGIYRNWGARFDIGDVLEIAGGGLDHKGNSEPDLPQLEWSITFWTVLPAVYQTGKSRTLVQAYDGIGAYLQINRIDKLDYLVAIDEYDTDERGEKKVINSGVPLNPKKKPGWYHIAAVCSYDNSTKT